MSRECVLCPVGTYAPGASIECTPCPQGFYGDQEGAMLCSICPKGRTTALLGATDVDECVSPELNFAAGFVTLAMVIPLTLEYVVHGRFHRVAFLRRSRVVDTSGGQH